MASPRTRQELGAAGEKIAGEFLRKLGYRILSRNFRCPLGELDLVCRDGDTFVFVEVKTRVDDASANPEESIGAVKRRNLERAASVWLQSRGRPRGAYRFDAVSVVLQPEGEPRVRHIIEAFLPSNSRTCI